MTEPVQPDDRRTRRRAGLLWFLGGLVALAAVAVTSAVVTDWSVRGSVVGENLTVDGTGSAPVLGAAPTDGPDASPDDTFGGPPVFSTPGVTAEPELQASATSSAQDAGHVQTTATATASAPAGIVPARDHGLHLILTATVSDLLRPGDIRTVRVSVHNPDSVRVQLYRLDVAVGQPAAAGCDPSWVRVGRYRYAGGHEQVIPAGGTLVVGLPIELVNLATVDQNACQHQSFPLTLSGIGVSTP